MDAKSIAISVEWDWVEKEVSVGERISDNIRPFLDECIRKARGLIIPMHTYLEKKITRLDADGMEIEGSIKFSTAKIPSYIKGATSLILFIVTIGDGIEKEASALTSGVDPLRGYLLDRIGSFAVESLAENLEKSLRAYYAAQKKSVSARFSPGYCDWALEEQFKISKSLDFSKAGVHLTEGCMMVPKKSISATVAVANEGIFTASGSTCRTCDFKDCGYRRAD